MTHVKGNSNYTISLEETGMDIDFLLCLTVECAKCLNMMLLIGMLLRALESDWDVLCKEVGLWIPAQIVNEEHDDNPEGREDIGNISCFFSQNSFFLPA